MKILVTGGAGFIGSHLVDRLIAEGNSVVVVDNLSTGKKESLNSKAVFYNTDICDDEISNIFQKEKPELVFHLAAQISVRKSVSDPIKDAKINILGSLNILENSRKYNIKKTIFASTGGVMYGNASIIPTPETYTAQPLCPYGICKLSVEHYLNYYKNIFNLKYIALRFGNVYGPRQDKNGEAGVVAIFCGKMLNNQDCVINGDGLQTRDYIYIKDVIKGLTIAAESDQTGIYNIGTGIETDVNNIYSTLKTILKVDGKAIHGTAKSGDHRRGSIDASRAQNELKWRFQYDINKGLIETANWFKENNNE